MSSFLAGWLYGVIHLDLLRDAACLLTDPKEKKWLTVMKDYYSFMPPYRQKWELTFLGQFLYLLGAPIYHLFTGEAKDLIEKRKRWASFGSILGIVVLSFAVLDPAKAALRKAKDEEEMAKPAKTIFFMHLIMAGLCFLHHKVQ